MLDANKKDYKNMIKFLIISMVLLFFSIFIFGVILVCFFQVINVPIIIAGTLASQLSILFYGLILLGNKLSINKIINEDHSFDTLWMGIKITIIVLLVNWITGFIFPHDGNIPDSTQQVLNNKSFLLTFLFPVIMAPICEEFTFRAGLKRALMDRGGFNGLMYVIISSVIFGLLHWQPASSTALAHVTLTTLMGVIYSITYLKTKSIYVSIVSHMLYNGIVVTLASFIQ